MTVTGDPNRGPRGTQGPTRMSWWWDLRCGGGFARECPVTRKLSEVREWRLLAGQRRSTRTGAVLRGPPGSLSLPRRKRLCCLGARDTAQVTSEQRAREVAVRRRFREGAAASAPD